MKSLSLIAILASCLLFSGCLATVPLGKSSEYGAIVIGYYPPSKFERFDITITDKR